VKLSDFDYHLPHHLIAQFPAQPRDSARLMVLHRETGEIEHRRFRDLPLFLQPKDLLVLNDTKVIPARLMGFLETGARVEVLLLKEVSKRLWEVMAKPARKLKPGRRLTFEGSLSAVVRDYAGRGKRLIEFEGLQDVLEKVEQVGHMPLPPYIRRKDTPEDRELYQTVFARRPGAVAAPTAGLHFTRELLEALERKGVIIKTVTLHVGPGTFKPVKTEKVEDHRMDPEFYSVPPDTAGEVNRALKERRRIVAVGTTVVRTLESAVDKAGQVHPGEGSTRLFIYPGYTFRVVSALITNFHLPRSTLLMLVCAFAGREKVLNAYRKAVEMGYRFYSFGDAMLVL